MSPDGNVTGSPYANSILVRDYVRDRLIDTTDGFNANLAVIAPVYGLTARKMSLTGNPPTLFMGRYDLPTIQKVVGQNYGLYCVLSVARALGGGKNNTRVTPSKFSGTVPISVDFYMQTNYGSMAPDGESWWFALEESMIQTFNGQQMVPMGVSYNNELDGEPGKIEWSDAVWTQVFSFSMLYGVIQYGF